MPTFSFEVGAVDVKLVEGSPRLIDKLLQIPDPKAQQTQSYRSGLCSGMKGYFNREKNTFPAGLLYRVEKRLIKRGHTVVKRLLAEPKRMSPCVPDYCIGIDMSGDRQYQCDAVDAAIEHFRGLLWLATNAGKCLHGDSRIQMSDGTLKRIVDVSPGDFVVSFNTDGDLKSKACRVVAVANNGVRPLLRVIVAGRVLRCTDNHPFLVSRGVWKNAGELTVGDLVALPGELPFFGDYDPPAHEVKLLAYMLADGGMTSDYAYHFTKTNPAIVEDFKQTVHSFEGSCVLPRVERGMTYSIGSTVRKRCAAGESRAAAKDFLDANIGRTHSRDKRIPEWVYRLTRPKLALFLRSFISCDGHISSSAVEVGLASREMLMQIVELLSRFGVTGSVRDKVTNFGTNAYIFYSHGAVCVRRFMREIGSLNPLHLKHAEIIDKNGPSKHDRIPVRGCTLVRRITSALARKLNRPRLRTDDSFITRAIASRWSDIDEECSAYADSHITWQPVDAVVPDDAQETYDLEVEGAHNFVANGVIVHNSSIIASLCGKVVRELKQKVVVVVPTGLLLHQTSKDIKQFLGPDVSVGLAGGGQKFRNPQVLVGTYQTLVRGVPTASGRSQSPDIQRFLESAGMVLVDEAQHAGSPSIQSILRTCGKALYRVGLTGTVDKRDLRITQQEDIKARFHRYEMEQYLGPVLIRVTNQDLIEKGISAIPTLYTVEDREAFGPVVQTPRQIPPGCGKPINIYGEVFTKAVIEDKRFRKSVMHVVAALLEQGKPPLIMSHSVDHLVALKKTADKWGIPVELVTGRESLRERQKVIDRFVKEQNFAILGSSCLDEGVSINAIRAVVLAGTRKSPVEILQRIGRGLRKKKDGPNTVTVVDFDPMHSTMLHKHFLTRAATYRAEGFPRHVIEDISTVSQINFP